MLPDRNHTKIQIMMLTHSCPFEGIIIVVADNPRKAFSRLCDVRGIDAVDDLPLSVVVPYATSVEMRAWTGDDYPTPALQLWLTGALAPQG